MIQRTLQQVISPYLFKGKAIIITGARQTGKTTLAVEIAKATGKRWLMWNCDEPDVEQYLNRPSSTELAGRIGNTELLVIDEAQRIENIGIALKLICDQIKPLQLLVTGSSALGLRDSIQEPLTGRKLEFHLHPLTFSEMIRYYSEVDEIRLLEQRLIYGMYPEIVTTGLDRTKLIMELAGDYLYKDILALESVRKPGIIPKLLRALALQVTNEISLTELGETAGCDRNTVIRYLDLLEKTFVIFSLSSINKNPRNEIKKSRKVYFWDNGIRNALINQFNPLNLRDDTGKLWENYLVCERIKRDRYLDPMASHYFWRTHQHQEIDLVIEKNRSYEAFEFKWNRSKTAKPPNRFMQDYTPAAFLTINPANYQDFLR